MTHSSTVLDLRHTGSIMILLSQDGDKIKTRICRCHLKEQWWRSPASVWLYSLQRDSVFFLVCSFKIMLASYTFRLTIYSGLHVFVFLKVLDLLINMKFWDFPFHNNKCICFQNNTPNTCVVTLKEWQTRAMTESYRSFVTRGISHK